MKGSVILYVLFSGVLLSFPWLSGFSGIFILLAFVPLLIIENEVYISESGKLSGKVFLYASLTFFTWNILTTWWIAYASVAGAATAIIVNTFLLSVVFWMFHITKLTLGKVLGYTSLVVYYVAFEYFYLNAEISWPWLNLGNAFANSYKLVQWYEYTGTLGGTVWILVANIVVYLIIEIILSRSMKNLFWNSFICFIIIGLPVVFSVFVYNAYNESVKPCSFTLVQPNIDSYNSSITTAQKYSLLIDLAEAATDDSTNFVIAPEVFLDDNLNEVSISNKLHINTLRNFVDSGRHTALIVGALTYRNYSANEIMSPTAHIQASTGVYYDIYNSALQISKGNSVDIYHKSKLVVGIEKMPYQKLLRFLKKPVEKFGGSIVSYGTQANRDVFVSKGHNFRIAPVICYESVYGEHVTGYVNNGANAIVIITNDGWWGNTPGYKQHLSFAKLRAIETRRSIARCASTGISAFINQRGDIIASTSFNERTAIKGSVNLNDKVTFYVKYGDFVGKIAVAVSIMILVLTLTFSVIRLKR